MSAYASGAGWLRRVSVSPVIDFSINAISREITLKRRSVQSYVQISLFPLDESGFPSAVNNTFLNLPSP